MDEACLRRPLSYRMEHSHPAAGFGGGAQHATTAAGTYRKDESSGWTIQFHWPVTVLLRTPSLVYAATILAAIYPSRVATKLVPIEVIHEE